MRIAHRLLLSLLTAFALGAASAQDDTLVLQMFGGVDSLDPAQSYDTASSGITDNLFENLYDYVGESVNEFEGLLAVDWSANEAGDQYTYQLREGVQFHSGNPFTCEDVEYSVERLLVHNPGDSGVWFLAESFLGTEQNADAYLGEDATDAEYDEYWAMIDGAVECNGDYEVVFNLNAPDPTFFSKMMSSVALIGDKQHALDNGLWDGTEATWRDWVGVNLRDYGLHDNPSGTGAYRLVDWDGETVIAEAFDGYWGEQPALRNVVVETVEEQSTRLLAVQAGDADFVMVGDRATLEQVRGASGVTIHEEDHWVSTTVTMVFFNQGITVEDNPDVGSGQLDGRGIPANFFADADARKCFAYNFDQQVFIEQVLQGGGAVQTFGIPQSFLGYDPTLPVYDFDFEMAEQHCRAAHDGQLWENGFEFTATYNAGNTARQAALEIIKENVEFMNPAFRMNVRSLSWPDYLAFTDEGKGTMFALGWAPSYADTDYFVHPFYHSNGFYAGRTGVSNPAFDALIDAARQTTVQSEREQIYRELGEEVYEAMPMLPTPSPTLFKVTRDNLQGVYHNPMYGTLGFLWKDVSKN